MAKTVKEAKSPAPKPTKPAAVKKAPVAKKAPAAVKKASAAKAKKAPTTNSKIHLMPATHEQIALLAHRFWAERGHQHGQHEADWYKAEQELRGKAS